VCAAGAVCVESVASAKAASRSLTEFDVVIVRDGDEKLLKQLRNQKANCQKVAWLKQSLIMGVAQL
jgi:hypothetical protein